jgi:putative spermidine/putrescine transport system permease protein
MPTDIAAPRTPRFKPLSFAFLRRKAAPNDEGDGRVWALMLVPSLIVFVVLLVASLGLFIEGSLHRDLGYGRTGAEWEISNYLRVFTDSFYLKCLWITVKVSAMATMGTMLLAFPVAYVIARLRSRWAMLLLAGIVASTFITIVIKVFGLMILFASNGFMNRTLVALGIVGEPIVLLGSEGGVVVGLMQFTLGFAVLLLYSVVQTIPRSYEEAAQALGANRLRVARRVLLPLCLPGISVGGLMIFNMCMGAFTSAALIGGGKVMTLPILIQRTIMMEVKYSMAATLAALLLFAVIAVNLLSIFLMRRMRAGRKVIA